MQKQMEAVLVGCKYYDFIINYHYSSHDYLTEKLVRSYQDYLFGIDVNDQKAMKIAVQLDQIMQVYLTTKRFYHMVQNYYIKDAQLSFEDVTDIIALYHDYIREEMMTISNTKWI